MSNTDFNKDARLRAIAMNAVREAMLLEERWDKPFTDDDAARCETIFGLLHLQKVESMEFEHAPLISTNQKPVTAALPKIADLLDKAEASSRVEPRPSLSAVKETKPREFA